MDPILPIGEVLLDPRLQFAPGEVVKTYWNAVAVLWHEAERSGRAVLPTALLPDCQVLIERGLAFQDEGHVFIPWVTTAWERVLGTSKQRSAAANALWDRRRKAAASTPVVREQCGSIAGASASALHVQCGALPSIPSVSSLPSLPEGGVQRGKPRASRRVPPGWVPKPRHEQIAAELGVDLAGQEAVFRDHEFARALTDFDAAFANWLRRAPTFGVVRARGPSPPRKTRAQEEADRIRRWVETGEAGDRAEVVDVTPGRGLL